ncbi:MAG: HEAT repeat domain-containing protein [Deltaproteobacteria bacterium]|nr:HEAT repeat domain-containing protein [Deltaproteobacteria bacterium]
MNKFASMILMLFVIVFLSSAMQSGAQDPSISEDVKRQIEILQAGTPKEKINAARHLGGMGAEAIPAVQYLIELLDSSERHRPLYKKILNVITIFGNFGRHVSDEARKSLTRIGMPAVTQLSDALVNHQRSGVRCNAASVLGDIMDIESVETLIIALRIDPVPEVRMSSAEALGKMAERRPIDSLSDVVSALVDALNDEDQNVRVEAADALGEMKAMTAVPALIETLERYGKDSHAGKALYKITRQQIGSDPQKWREWWDNESRSE